jgi:O-antigen ligase
MFLGLPGFSKMSGGRMSAAGFNPNGLAVFMALGAQALLEFGIEQTLRNIWMRATFMAMSLFLLMAMVYTGSRGGIIAGMAGVALYALPHCKSKRKMAAILGATIAVVGVVYITVNDQSTLSRFELTYDTGNTAGRDMIYASAIEMIAEKPLLGWGPIVWWYELGRRTASPYITRDAHNLFLHLLLDGGLLGAMPFLIGFGLCVQAAWTARGHSLGLLPLVWSTTMIVASMSATMGGKILWLVLTFNLASGASTIKQYKRKNLVIRTILQHLSQRDISHTKDIHT